MKISSFLGFFILAAFLHGVVALQTPTSSTGNADVSRRSVLLTSTKAMAAAAIAVALPMRTDTAHAAQPNGLPLTTAPSSGLKWADAKVGTGQPLQEGAVASIDYTMASTAGRFPQIYSTKDTGAPYRWKLGDGSTIRGIELAILGDESDGIPPMLPGSIRRVIVTASYGFQKLAQPNSACEAGKPGSIGPIPPKDNSGAYQRWYQFYCNPRIPYQPDLVLDIKLYGKR